MASGAAGLGAHYLGFRYYRKYREKYVDHLISIRHTLWRRLFAELSLRVRIWLWLGQVRARGRVASGAGPRTGSGWPGPRTGPRTGFGARHPGPRTGPRTGPGARHPGPRTGPRTGPSAFVAKSSGRFSSSFPPSSKLLRRRKTTNTGASASAIRIRNGKWDAHFTRSTPTRTDLVAKPSRLILLCWKGLTSIRRLTVGICGPQNSSLLVSAYLDQELIVGGDTWVIVWARQKKQVGNNVFY